MGPELVPVVDEGAVHVPVDQVREIMNILFGKSDNEALVSLKIPKLYKRKKQKNLLNVVSEQEN